MKVSAAKKALTKLSDVAKRLHIPKEFRDGIIQPSSEGIEIFVGSLAHKCYFKIIFDSGGKFLQAEKAVEHKFGESFVMAYSPVSLEIHKSGPIAKFFGL